MKFFEGGHDCIEVSFVKLSWGDMTCQGHDFVDYIRRCHPTTPNFFEKLPNFFSHSHSTTPK